jgi:hypothetical protein
MFHGKYPAKEYRNGEHIGPGPWLTLVQESGIFGARTSIGPWWAGGESEEYPDARIIRHADGETVSVAAKTETGSAALEMAEQRIRGEHTLEIRVERWYRVTISMEHLENTLRDEASDTARDDDESIADWYRRNAGEHVLARLLTDECGREMSGVTMLPDAEHTLVSFDRRQW